MTDSSSQGGDAGRIARLEAELAEARERLRELDHRIKNDLQLVASVFLLQQRRVAAGPERDTVRGALERINAVLAVHRRLDPGRDAARIDVAPVVREVAEEALQTARRDDLELACELPPLSLPARHATPLALIAGELVRNAARHAYPGRGGQVRVGMAAQDGQVALRVADNGVGCAAKPDGFGATLVGLLAQQLRGQVEWSDATPGLRAVVRFPEPG